MFSKRLFGAFLFDLNICMIVETEKDFPQMRSYISEWRKKFPMFYYDVDRIEKIINAHIQNYSIACVNYRQSKKKNYLEQAQKEIDEINRVLQLVEKIELMALLSKR